VNILLEFSEFEQSNLIKLNVFYLKFCKLIFFFLSFRIKYFKTKYSVAVKFPIVMSLICFHHFERNCYFKKKKKVYENHSFTKTVQFLHYVLALMVCFVLHEAN